MRGFEWAEQHLDPRLDCRIRNPYDLRNRGVEVFVAPQVQAARRVINLRNGRIERFAEGQAQPREGYFADFESLARFCGVREVPLCDEAGTASFGRGNETAAPAPGAEALTSQRASFRRSA